METQGSAEAAAHLPVHQGPNTSAVAFPAGLILVTAALLTRLASM
ncbi:MAG TPA: hypothetical protein VFU98_16060 [Microlunatus sp.]|nr:hypothetical protein [Microlunatus sp.]